MRLPTGHDKPKPAASKTMVGVGLAEALRGEKARVGNFPKHGKVTINHNDLRNGTMKNHKVA
jgi:hypothetical protein